MLPSIQYQLPDEWDLERLKAELSPFSHLLEAEAGRLDQLYLDSFGWQVWQAGAELVFERSERGGRLSWIERHSGEIRTTLKLDAPPGFPAELPEGELRQLLAEALDMRRLLPMVRVVQRLQTLRVLNEDEKTVLRLVLQTSHYAKPNGKPKGPLDSRLLLRPVKGYQKPLARMQTELDNLGLQPVSHSLFEAALAGIGRRPGDYSSKLNYRLDPESRSDATAKQIMLSLLHTLEANIEGTRANLDSEFLHDLRVATRRTRSAMTQIKGVFDERELAPFKQGFAWIGQITGPTRDMDVYLLKFDAYQRSLPAKLRQDLEPFREFLREHHAKAQKTLVKKLNSPHFRKLIKEWRQWLEAPVDKVSTQPNAQQPIARLADRRIFKVYKRVLNDGLAIEPGSPAESMHDLRKDCKKLRYLMEFFQSLYPKPEVSRLIKQLKVLLDNLGDFQDLQVQAEAIEAFGEEMLQEGAPARALMAMGVLVGNLLERQEQARDEFAALFREFSTEESREAFKQLFGNS